MKNRDIDKLKNMAGFQAPITIHQAIDRIRKNEYLLPAFQREFVWSSDQIQKLFDSLMKGYPISSMLFWKVKGETNRYLDKRTNKNKDKDRFVVSHMIPNVDYSLENFDNFIVERKKLLINELKNILN